MDLEVFLKYFPESIQLIFGGSGIVVSGSIAVLLNIILPLDEKIKKSLKTEKVSQ